MAIDESKRIINHQDGVDIASAITKISTAINDQEKNVHLSDDQTITGAKTFSSQVTASGGVKTDKVTSTNGTEVLSYDGTTTALKGKADRPTYNGVDLALKSDVPNTYELLTYACYNMWANGSYVTNAKNATAYADSNYLNFDVTTALSGIDGGGTIIRFTFPFYNNKYKTNILNAITPAGKKLSEYTSGEILICEAPVEIIAESSEIKAYLRVMCSIAAYQLFCEFRGFSAAYSGNVLVQGHMRISLNNV